MKERFAIIWREELGLSRKTVSAIMMSLLVLGMLTLAFDIQPAPSYCPRNIVSQMLYVHKTHLIREEGRF
jgi:hypothetical protein